MHKVATVGKLILLKDRGFLFWSFSSRSDAERGATSCVSVCSLHVIDTARSASSRVPNRTDRTRYGCICNDHSQEFLSSIFEFPQTLPPFGRVDAPSTVFSVWTRLLTSPRYPLMPSYRTLILFRLVAALPRGCESKVKSFQKALGRYLEGFHPVVGA